MGKIHFFIFKQNVPYQFLFTSKCFAVHLIENFISIIYGHPLYRQRKQVYLSLVHAFSGWINPGLQLSWCVMGSNPPSWSCKCPVAYKDSLWDPMNVSAKIHMHMHSSRSFYGTGSSNAGLLFVLLFLPDTLWIWLFFFFFSRGIMVACHFLQSSWMVSL